MPSSFSVLFFLCFCLPFLLSHISPWDHLNQHLILSPDDVSLPLSHSHLLSTLSLSSHEESHPSFSSSTTSSSELHPSFSSSFDSSLSHSSLSSDERSHSHITLESDSSEVIPSELYALSSLYTSLNGNQWLWDSNTSYSGKKWNFTGTPHPCHEKWQRITCYCLSSSLCFVVKLDLSIFNLNGTIPPAIQYFSQLVYLNMANNTLLGGPVPPQLGSLSKLIYLSMYITHLTGTLPNELQNLRSLQYFIFGKVINFNDPLTLDRSRHDSISGPYPSFLSNLSNLLYIYLYGTQHTGTIPSSWSTMTQLYALVLGGTFITGTLPSWAFENLTNLSYFVVGTGTMTGTISSSIGSLINCKIFSINGNYFQSTIPSTISSLSAMEYFYIYGNSFNGTFPKAISEMKSLQYLFMGENLFTGSIPYHIVDLSSLVFAAFDQNLLTSTIPPEIGRLTKLQLFDLSLNRLEGTLPSSMSSLSSLQILNLTGNSFAGPLDSLQKLSLLQSLSLSHNKFSSSLPSGFSSFGMLQFLQLEQNHLTGTLPEWIMMLKDLISITLTNNYFSGSIPTTISLLSSLIYLDLSRNSFGSSLPSQITLLTSLQYLILEECEFIGTLPSNLGDMKSLRSLKLKENQFSGTLSHSISSLSLLKVLDLSENLFVGSLPSTMKKLQNLQYLFIQNNQFDGTLDSLVDPDHQFLLSTIDISDNAFTGTIPNQIFKLNHLQHFAAVINCLHGSLSHSICSADHLEVLALDGIGAAEVCRLKFFSSISRIKSYGLLYGLDGTIPTCLFDMKSLKTLHLSGNKITGSIPSHLNVSQNLDDLSLSHNLLTGSIPESIQKRVWTLLDLSFNKFYGSLSSNFATYPSSSSLRLLVNRLSGGIPISIQQAINVSVLDGNLFECDVYNGDKGLPKHDSATGVYQCADSFQELSYTWMSPYLCFLVVALFSFFFFSVWKEWSDQMYRFAEKIDQYMTILDQPIVSTGRTSSILLFKKFIVDWEVTCIFFSLYNIFIMLPVWVVLTIFFNTYQFEYSWSASVAYLSGFTPAVVSLVMFSFLLATVFSMSTTNTERHKSRRTSNFVAIELPESPLSRLYHYSILSLIIVFDCIVVIGVNVLYVVATNRFNKTIVTFCALAVAVFKFAWNIVIFSIFEMFEKHLFKSTRMSGHIIQKYQQRDLITQSLIGLINNIFIPLLSTASVSSTCYFYFFQAAKPIVASFVYSECVVQTVLVYACQIFESVTVCNDVVGVSYVCLGENPIQRTTSFIPPFNYSYQCSSTFIASYAAVYVYTYLMVAFGSPVVTLLFPMIRQCFSKGSIWIPLIDYLLPKYLIPVTDDPESMPRKLFNKNRFVSFAITDTAVLITFGAIFPPLSLVICVAIIIRALSILFSLGKLLSNAEERGLKNYSQQLLQDCADIPEIFGKLLWLILPFAALIFSLFLFDTHGDQVSWRHAYPLPLVMCFIPFLFLLFRKIYKSPQIKPMMDKYLEWIRDHVPLAWILLKSRPKEMGLRATIIVSQSTRLSILPNARKIQNEPQSPTSSSKVQSFSPNSISPIVNYEEGKRSIDEKDNDLGVNSIKKNKKIDENRQAVMVMADLDLEEIA